MPELVRLSASRIKTAEQCSWRYYCKYVLKLPDESNDGARRGSITHAILECLLKPERSELVSSIIEKGVKNIPVIQRMISIQAVHYELNLDEENLEFINKFLTIGLKFDFYLDEFDLQDPELAFDITNEEGNVYRMIGFIDKYGLSERGHARIVDYKTSKQKFTKDELGFSIQALMYMLALKKLHPDLKKIDVDFLFLKFPLKPLQRITLNEQNLETSLLGVEEYLGYMTGLLQDFDLEKATANFAWDDYDRKWLCGRNPKKWKCPFRNKFRYYVLVDTDGTEIKTVKTKTELEPTEGQSIKTREYTGCPKLHWENR